MAPSRHWRSAVRGLAGAEHVVYYLEAGDSGRALVRRYVPGPDAADAVAAAAELRDTDRWAALTQLTPPPAGARECDRIVDSYAEALARLGRDDLAEHGRAEVCVNPEQLGLGLPDGHEPALARLHHLVRCAAAVDTTVTLDLDDPRFAAAAVRLAAAAREETPSLGVTVRADLQRTIRDVRGFARAGARVRLLRGDLAAADGGYRRGGTIDRAYVRCLRELMTHDCYPMIATQDSRLLDIAAALARQLGRTPDSYEFQMRYGVRAEEQRRIADRGHRMRILIPWGREWHDYVAARLAERHTGLWQLARVLGRRG